MYFSFFLEKYTYHEIFMCTKKYNRYDIIGIAMNEQNKNKTQKNLFSCYESG